MSQNEKQLTLVVLSETLLYGNAGKILDQLRDYGHDADCGHLHWHPLSGGREYATCTLNNLFVSGIASTFSMEITRTKDGEGSDWVETFELRPANEGTTPGAKPNDQNWWKSMSLLLETTYEEASPSYGGPTIYRRGSLEEVLLYPPTDNEPARLIMHRRSLIHNPE